MRRTRLAALLLLLPVLCAAAPPDLARDNPTLRALLIARGDCVVFEYYRAGLNANARSPLRSVTKSVLSALIGAAIRDARLRLDSRLSSVYSAAPLAPGVGDVSLRDLLTMTSGLSARRDSDASTPAEALATLPARTLQSPTGQSFHYDNDSANLASAMLAKAIRDPRKFLSDKLFRPLGISNFDWAPDEQGRLSGAGGLSLTARDLAKIGLLYLRRGAWNRKAILDPKFVADSLSRHSDGGPPGDAAYGYLWWVKRDGDGEPAFFAEGAGGQLLYVAPRLDLVAVTSADGDVEGGMRKWFETRMFREFTDSGAPTACRAHLAP